jgi:potassium efflux system protein
VFSKLLKIGLGLTIALAPAFGQDSIQDPIQDPVQGQGLPGVAEWQARLDGLGVAQQGDPAELQARRAMLQELLGNAASLARFEADRSGWLQASAEAESLEAALGQHLEAPVQEASAEPDPNASADDLAAAADQAEADLAVAHSQVEELDEEALRRERRLGPLRDEIAQLGQRVTELEARAAAFSPTQQDEVLAGLERDQGQSKLALERGRLASLVAERDSYAARRELLPLRRDAAKVATDLAAAKVAALREAANTKGRAEAEAALAEAKERALRYAESLGPLRPLAQEIADLASIAVEEQGVLEAARKDLAQVQADRVELGQRFADTIKRVAIAGNIEGVGALLRREFESLGGMEERTRSLRQLRVDLSRAQLQELDFQARREAVAAEYQGLVSQLEAGGTQVSPEVADAIREMLASRRSQLTDLEGDATALVNQLLSLQQGMEERGRWLSTYGDYISERILWVPSRSGRILPNTKEVGDAIAWLVDPVEWRAARKTMRDASTAAWLQWSLVVLACLCLWAVGRSARSQLERTAEVVRSYRTDSIRHTLRALVASILLATRLPSTLLVFGLGLYWLAPQAGPARAVATGLLSASSVLYVMRFMRALVLPKGLGVVHFRWPARTCAFLMVRIQRFSIPFAACVALVVAFDHAEATRAAELGRGIFCLAMALLATLLYRVLHPSGEVIGEYRKRRPGWLFEGGAPTLHKLVALVPVALGVGALAGYYYTALRLAESLALSLAFALLLVLVYGLLLRWLFLVRRGLALTQARARASARAEAAEAAGDESYAAMPIDEEALDLPAVNAQTQQLFRFAIICTALLGLLGIWSSTLPALRVLERIQIWPSFEWTEEGEGSDPSLALLATVHAASAQTEEPAPAGAVEAESPGFSMMPGSMGMEAMEGAPAVADESEPVTLADLGIALLILILTLGAARNLPSLVEIVLLQRLGLDAGSRSATSTLVRYVILIPGVILCFGAVGISWGSIQWLAAALTFGLAFGLQEIFANFVSGLIILIERPLRVGDIVTVAGIEGRVTRVRMRATTVLDYERRELLVPNREFITGSLINWTLSDPFSRLLIPVGIAYGSDVEKARELLIQAGRDSKLVVQDPGPEAIFRAFGASSLDFELRVHLSNRELWHRASDDLHRRIDALFRQGGIEIAFPQRDLHLRTSGPLADALGGLQSGRADLP